MFLECVLCGSKKLEKVFENRNQSITSDSILIDEPISNSLCLSCGHVFNETGARNKVESFYSDSYKLMNTNSSAEFKYFNNNSGLGLSSLRFDVLSQITSLKKTGKILDIGCGKGNFLLEFSSKNPEWKLFGVELSKNALKFTKQNLPSAILYEGLFNSDIFDEKFDIITTMGVLEHLEEPKTFLNEVSLNLKDDGLFFFDVPNFKLNPIDLHVFDHLNHFTKETLQNLINSSNFKIVKVIEFNDKLPLFLICKKSSIKQPIKNFSSMMKELIHDHINFNNSMFELYKKTMATYDTIGVFGLGLHIWAAIQNNILKKENIYAFFDENDSLIGTKKQNIPIKSITELRELDTIPLVFSLNPCYMDLVRTKLDKEKINYFIPDNYQYYKKYF